MRILIKLIFQEITIPFSNIYQNAFTWSAYPMLQSNRGPEMDRTKFMQVVIVAAFGGFQNLSFVGTGTDKQAG